VNTGPEAMYGVRVLRVRVFGGLALEGGGATVPRSSRVHRLLAWLACHPGMHARSKLAGLFWPDVLDESARASLRGALSELRHALGPAAVHVVATRAHVGLAGDGLEVDVREFDALLARGRAEEALAVARRGELLAGLEDEWVHDARDRVLHELTVALGSLATAAAVAGDFPRAVRLARERATLDPLSEEAGRELIRLLAAAGDRAAALASYDSLARRLRERLAVAPSAATREVVAAIGREDPGGGARQLGAAAARLAPGEPLPLPPALARAEASPFVGRDAELAALRGAWGAAAAVDGAAELAAIVPELVPPGLEPPAADPVAARARLFGAIGAALGRIAAARALLLVVDDLHWADRPTLLLFSHLLRFVPTERLMLVATYRDTDVAPDGQLAEWLEAQRRERILERISVSGLDQRAVASLVESWVDDPEAGLAQRLHARTAGNALFVEEILKRLAAGGAAVPGGVEDAIRARLARLSPPALAVLRAAAVAGRGAEVALPRASRARATRTAASSSRTRSCATSSTTISPPPGALTSTPRSPARSRPTIPSAISRRSPTTCSRRGRRTAPWSTSAVRPSARSSGSPTRTPPRTPSER